VGEVHAFEPTPASFRLLRENLLNLPMATVNNAAVLAHEGTTRLMDYGAYRRAWNAIGAGRLTPQEGRG